MPARPAVVVHRVVRHTAGRCRASRADRPGTSILCVPPPAAQTARVTLADDLCRRGVTPRAPLAVVLVPGASPAVGLAWPGGALTVAGDPTQVVRELASLDPRWTWWSARDTAAPLVAAGLRLRACWDLGAVGRLVHGLRRDDPAAVWAASAGLAEPAELRGGTDLFDLDAPDGAPVRPDGQLSRQWLRGDWTRDPARWAVLALELQARQEAELSALPDPRRQPRAAPLAVLSAWAESAAALLAVELERTGLPLDRSVAASHLVDVVGPPPADVGAERASRAARDAAVLRAFPGPPVDLRSPLQVRELLLRSGFDLPDTRSWRLEPHAATSPGVAALLRWRKAERLTTTYAWSWLERHVGADGRLRGQWRSADGAAGRMTASAGLHNLPAELRPAVRAEPGHLLVRADLGQVEPRVLAVVSGDLALAGAAREDDLYAPVAAALVCDRPTAKVAVLAAMYGQTSGAAGAALRDMERAYPTALAHLRAAERAGVAGRDLRTWGGRRLRFTASELPGAGRFARNAVVQGAAAELFKAWAATVRDGLAALDGEVVLCLHDELLLHVRADAAPAAAALLGEALQATVHWWAAGSPVRFVAEVSSGPTWGG
jgi:DNA polymerase-1